MASSSSSTVIAKVQHGLVHRAQTGMGPKKRNLCVYIYIYILIRLCMFFKKINYVSLNRPDGCIVAIN
ncbi:hypothetical protein HanXRQr2_Chr09g0369711 [Helianthus annuus]|uniref:Uncharacterized protein n=1 Tax=Helianthus annuus TaxID=4232 RepID=A0A251TSK2_HELAN|nr:hypothetical protein HanXRQr2_Chr09g0369711 [Helianthus annuus]